MCSFLQVFARIKTLVTKPDALRMGISASDAALTLGIAPAMAKEHLLTAENQGMVPAAYIYKCAMDKKSNKYGTGQSLL